MDLPRLSHPPSFRASARKLTSQWVSEFSFCLLKSFQCFCRFFGGEERSLKSNNFEFNAHWTKLNQYHSIWDCNPWGLRNFCILIEWVLHLDCLWWSHVWSPYGDPPSAGIGQWLVTISHNRQWRPSGRLKFNLLPPFKRPSTKKSLSFIDPSAWCSSARLGDRERKRLESLFWILVYRFSLLLSFIEPSLNEFGCWRQLSHSNNKVRLFG